jgi:hypothetical protein
MKNALLILAALIALTFATNAQARGRHHHHSHGAHRHVHVHHAHHRHHHHLVSSGHRHRSVHLHAKSDQTYQAEAPSWFGGSSLVSAARSHLGQTARQVGVRTTLWCSAFIRKLSPGTSGVDDRAISWASRPHVGPSVGKIAVLGRHHVGIVSGFTSNGDPIVISGNHGHRVAESVYPKHRVLAYVEAR